MVSTAIEARCKRCCSTFGIRCSMEYGKMLDKISKCLGQLLGSYKVWKSGLSLRLALSPRLGLEFPFNTPLPFQVPSVPFSLTRILVLHLVLNVTVWFSSRDNTEFYIRYTKLRIADMLVAKYGNDEKADEKIW